VDLEDFEGLYGFKDCLRRGLDLAVLPEAWIWI